MRYSKLLPFVAAAAVAAACTDQGKNPTANGPEFAKTGGNTTGTTLGGYKTLEACTEADGSATFFGAIVINRLSNVATQNLKINDLLQKTGSTKWSLVASGVNTALGPADATGGILINEGVALGEIPACGSSDCDPNVTFFYRTTGTYPDPRNDALTYRNTANVTITNHSGWQPGDNNCPGTALCPFGPSPKATLDKTKIAACNRDTGGCTRTIGYWKNHDGSGPQPDEITQFLPILLGTAGGLKTVTVTTAAQASTILGIPTASNGIDKLRAQLLGAKLNIAAGASGTSIAADIVTADGILALYDSTDWSTLSLAQQDQILALKTTFDSYNNGLIGPGHCPS